MINSSTDSINYINADRIAPFLWDDIANLKNWRDRVAWPISGIFSRKLGDSVVCEAMSVASKIENDFEKQLVMVSSGRFINGFLSLAEAAYVAQGEVRENILPIGGPPELDAMRKGGEKFSVLEDRHRGKGVIDIKPVGNPVLRSIARTASWTYPSTLPVSMLFPKGIAITHNAMLRNYAKYTGEKIRYWPAANILNSVRSLNEFKDDEYIVSKLTEHMAKQLMSCVVDLEEPWYGRLNALFIARLTPTVRQISSDLRSLRKLKKLPKCLWTGTGSAYATRVIASEIERRGGEVTGFGHGGVTAISQSLPLTANGELMIASRFCVGTQAWAHLLEESKAAKLSKKFGGCKIIYGLGEPTFRSACIDSSANKKLRVLYIGHPYRALRQFALAGTPDVLYWDLQSRVAKFISGLNVNLICKPHPEGHFVGCKNPIEDIAPTSYKRFESHLKETDVFVFDAPTSTTFAEALCTNRPVVLIDRGHYPVNPSIEKEIFKRCRLVETKNDNNNRINPDFEALEAAILGRPYEVDPSYFRMLLAGVS